MSSDESDLTPESIKLDALGIVHNIIPENSKEKYLKAYNDFDYVSQKVRCHPEAKDEMHSMPSNFVEYIATTSGLSVRYPLYITPRILNPARLFQPTSKTRKFSIRTQMAWSKEAVTLRAQRLASGDGRAAVGMRRARSVTGPLRRAYPASGATWNVQVVRGKMSSQCLWHACRALSAGLLLMLLGAAMAVIGYYADTLSVAQEIRGNATISVKDEARGFHLNNLSYAGPIVMGFGGFIVVAACVMTFEARDSAAKVTPARPQAMPRPLPRRGPPCAAPARLDQLGVYRLPHVLPLPHALPLAPLHRHRPPLASNRAGDERGKNCARFGSAPDLRAGNSRAVPASALRRPLRRYALSVDEPPHSAVSASAAESECGSQSSLALDLHGSGACAGVTLRVRDNTRRRPLARQQRLRDDTVHPVGGENIININNPEDIVTRNSIHENHKNTVEMVHLSAADNSRSVRASSAPPEDVSSPPPSPRLMVTPCTLQTTSQSAETYILIDEPVIEPSESTKQQPQTTEANDIPVIDKPC